MSKKTTKKDEPYVVQYETKNDEYRYSSFWDTRNYEDRAERILLRKLLKLYPKKSNWLIDIGGSFGRLLDIYAKRFKQVVIVDYATNEFYLGVQKAKDIDINLSHIAANAYHLPFSDNSQTSFISVRVVHHLTEPEQFFSEIERTLVPGGMAIIEAANKNSLKRLARCIIKFDFSDWRADWLDIGASGLQEDGNFHLIRNYHPRYLEARIKETGLKVFRRRSVSWFRGTPITKLPRPIVDFLEKCMQMISGLFFYGPSSWYVVYKPGELPDLENTWETTLAVPPSNKKLTANEDKKITKTSKKVKYRDLRYPRPRK